MCFLLGYLKTSSYFALSTHLKMSFSSSDKDTALSYLHDLGFIPKIVNGEKGFKVI